MRASTLLCLSAFVLLGSLTASAQVPSNDICATAIPITCDQTISATTEQATLDSLDDCGPTITAPGVWFVFQGTAGQVLLSTCETHSYDTKISVFTGTCDELVCVGGNDDGTDCNYGSSYAFVAQDGVTYYVLVHGYEEETGTFDLELQCIEVPNDDCAGAIPIACNQTISGNTVPATLDNVADCVTGIAAPGIWYTFTGVEGTVLLSTCETYSYDTRMNVYSGSCGNLTCVIGNDDVMPDVYCSEVAFAADANTTYFILMQGYNGETGQFDLLMSCPSCGTPVNIGISPADTAALVDWTSTNTGSSFNLEYGTAGFTPGTGTTVTGVVGTNGPPLTLGGLMLGTDYEVYVQELCGIGDVSGNAGPFAFTTLSSPLPANVLCSGALPLACDSSVTGDTSLGIATPGPTCGPANITSKGLWYTFMGNGDDVILSTCGQAGFDTKISVFTGTCSSLICAAGGDDQPGCPGNSTRVVLPTVTGTSYLILVHGYQQDAGIFTMNMTCAPVCSPAVPNDDCSTAQGITPAPIGACKPYTGTLECAYASPEVNPDCDPYGTVSDVWYSFNSGTSSTCTITVENVNAQSVSIAIYSACNSLQYITCEAEIDAPLDLTGLDLNTDHFIRVWNAGGSDAGTFLLCIEAEIMIGVEEQLNDQNIHLWPNPAHELLQITGAIRGPVVVLDLQGRMVMNTSLIASPTVIDIHELAHGMYVLKSENGVLLGRFVKN
ncbi:MAG: T9SS type A sorting domain-containing protein [Flavobacteriales bacterium]